jgi:hypothetical protein
MLVAICLGMGCGSRWEQNLPAGCLLVFGTGNQLVIFYRHHLVRDLTLDRSRRYQALSQPRRRDHNRDQLQLELQTHPPTPRGTQGRPTPAPTRLPRGAAEAPESRAAVGRRPIAPATLESGGVGWRPYTQRGATQPPTNCHRCLDNNCHRCPVRAQPGWPVGGVGCDGEALTSRFATVSHLMR